MHWTLGHVNKLPSKITSRLAPEIYDRILVNFHDSKHHLSNFSVVSSLWLSLCRYYLFAEVQYRANFALFLGFSSHAISTIAPYIKKLKVHGNVMTDTDKARIMEFIFSLPNLRSLYLNNMDIGAVKPLFLSAENTRYLRLKLCSLNLRSTHFSAFDVLADLLESSPALKNLSLESVTWDQLHHNANKNEPARRSVLLGSSLLEKLNIDFCHDITVLNWLQYGVISDTSVGSKTVGHRSFPRLKALSVLDILPTETKTMDSLLSTLDSTLEELEIGLIKQYDGGTNNQAVPWTLDLSSNINIKSLVFHHITLFHFPDTAETTIETNYPSADSPYMWLIHVLLTVKSTALRVIGFHVWVSDESQLNILPWPIMDQILGDLTPHRLEFYISGIATDIELVRGWFTKRLIKVSSGGTTDITFRFVGLT